MLRRVPPALRRWFWTRYAAIWDRQNARPPTDRALQLADAKLGDWLLDAGCGTGTFSVAAAERGMRVLGIDTAPGMLQRARAKRRCGLVFDFLPIDLDHPAPFRDGAFSAVLAISSLQLTADPYATLAELRRVLARNGRLVVLHAPRTADSLVETIHQRVAANRQPTITDMLLIAAKATAERLGGISRWTTPDLAALIAAQGFDLAAIDDGPPSFIVAVRAPELVR